MDVILAGNSYVKNWGKGTHSGAANKRYQPPARSTRARVRSCLAMKRGATWGKTREPLRHNSNFIAGSARGMRAREVDVEFMGNFSY